MAVDMFLKIDRIPGESTDAKHKDEIDLMSFHWGVTQVGAEFGAAGKVSVQDFSFSHLVDKASPKLFLACATGEHLKQALLTVRKAGGDQQEYLKYRLSDLMVSKVEPAQEPPIGILPQTPTAQFDVFLPTVSDRPMESFSLNFVKIEIMYTSPDGKQENAGFDFKRRRVV